MYSPENCCILPQGLNTLLTNCKKHYFEGQGKKVKIVSIMPCTAKKREILARGTIDRSLTTRELAELIRLKGIDFNEYGGHKGDWQTQQRVLWKDKNNCK